MAKFILINENQNESLLNIDNIVSIRPYQADYSNSELKGVMIKVIGETEEKLYTGIEYNSLKNLLLNK